MKENKKVSDEQALEWGTHMVWCMQLVSALSEIKSNRQQLAACRKLLLEDGPEQFLEYTTVLNSGCQAGLINESVALPLFNRMSDIYFEQYDEVVDGSHGAISEPVEL